ncbi:DUF6923 family protein [Amycolatopsis suaedae]|uniref:DUF6923 domain-containing protein n=1 Tax=Amycolatopsis suaedae TaxID=2510978 RepID=A0A4Q7JA53_9PSEU|nr:hypothetical protein [Amycolatopsis suaedae]RZQ63792.1 hypothetical protein EWH70_11530 [Amycolatopsis suaedae]
MRLPAVVLVAIAATGLGPVARAQPATCVILQAVHRPGYAALERVELPSGRVTRTTRLPSPANALGHLPGTGRGYALSGGRVLAIDPSGRVSDLGRLSGPAAGATAGVVRGDRWYLRRGARLYTVDIRPGSPTYLKAAYAVSLRPAGAALDIDDLAADPADGLFYGVTSHRPGRAGVVSVDPRTGAVRTLPSPVLPPATAYGSVVLTGDGTLYATANNATGRARTYRIDRRAGTARELFDRPPVLSSDATGCLGSAPPPVPPPATTTPPRTTTTTTTTTTTPPRPLPPVPPPAPTPTTSGANAVAPTGPRPSAIPTSRRDRPLPVRPIAEPKRDDGTEDKRRWGLVAVLLVVGGAAAARHLVRR